MSLTCTHATASLALHTRRGNTTHHPIYRTHREDTVLRRADRNRLAPAAASQLVHVARRRPHPWACAAVHFVCTTASSGLAFNAPPPAGAHRGSSRDGWQRQSALHSHAHPSFLPGPRAMGSLGLQAGHSRTPRPECPCRTVLSPHGTGSTGPGQYGKAHTTSPRA